VQGPCGESSIGYLGKAGLSCIVGLGTQIAVNVAKNEKNIKIDKL
jgi:hypothetical protein